MYRVLNEKTNQMYRIISEPYGHNPDDTDFPNFYVLCVPVDDSYTSVGNIEEMHLDELKTCKYWML